MPPRFINTLAARLGITRALVYAVLGRTWSIMAGPISLLFIGRFLNKDEQGFYYTFWSILGLWVFFDFGLSLIIVQFASHERASLRMVDGHMEGDPRARQRLASLYTFALRWYGWAAASMIAVVLPAGFLLFGRYRPPHLQVNWVGPWILVVLTCIVNLTLGPLASVLDGSGMYQDMALMRLLQGMTANVCLWIALLFGAGLYSAVILNGMMAVFSAAWLFTRHRRFFRDLRTVRPDAHLVSWRAEIWPFQWRFALSWLASYFVFQIFNPILFATRGPRVAGQMGMSLMVTTALWMFAQAWINTHSVDFGALVAARDFDQLDRNFRHVLTQSSAVLVMLSAAVIAVIDMLRHIGHPLAERLLPPLPLVILLGATVLNHVINAEAMYLRAFKREAFAVIYVPIFVITAVGSLAVARPFGVIGMVTVLALTVTVIGLGGGTALFLTRRRQWRQELPAAAATTAPIELPTVV